MFNTLVTNIYVQVDDKVDVNQVVAQGQITKAGGQIEYVNLKSNSAGTVYNIFVNENDVITSRSTVWMEIVEQDEMFTNEDEYEAKYAGNEPFIDGTNIPSEIIGRSTDPMDPDTDNDGLIDGIEVFGWEILVSQPRCGNHKSCF